MSLKEDPTEPPVANNDKSFFTPTKSATFIFGVAGGAAVGGFGMMLAKTRKSSPDDFHKGTIPIEGEMESGARLAMRALGRATVYAVGGFSLFCFTVWKLMGVHSLPEFTAKMQSIMPKIPPAKTSTGEEVDWEEIFGTKKKEGEETSANTS